MAKGIIVVDVPESCEKCPCKMQMFDIHYMCMVSPNREGAHRPIHLIREKPDWCPIRPIKRKPGEPRYQNQFEKGWNACLNEILKEGD